MGDGMLMCFSSVVEAVACSLEIQREFTARGAANENALEHRIGVHLGDVFRSEEGQVVGDGVNIAARLEGKALLGGVCVSQSVYDAVNGKISFQARFAGPLELKNIGQPIQAWHLVPEGVTWPVAGAAVKREPRVPGVARNATGYNRAMIVASAGALLVALGLSGWWFSHRAAPAAEQDASIAVLPFANMSEDKDAGYFADGVHEDLLTQLASLGALKVVSRTSVMEYRNTAKNVRQIGGELHVAYLVEGSVRRVGDQVRVTAQLIDTRTDQHVWAKNYDRKLADIFAIQSELSRAIADELNVSITAPQAAQLARKPTENLEAYDLYLRAQVLFNSTNGGARMYSTAAERIALLEKAVALDPNFALAWARLAIEHARTYDWLIDTSPARQQQAKQAIERALALAPDHIDVRIAEGEYYRFVWKDFNRAAQALESALRVAPNNVAALSGLASVRYVEGRTEELVTLRQRILAIDPRHVTSLTSLSNTQLRFRHFAEAQASLVKMLEIRPDEPDFAAKLRWVHYLETGDWGADYDAWRAGLPQDIYISSGWVPRLDMVRAVLRRDFDEAQRLSDKNRAASNLSADIDELFASGGRAQTMFAKGDTRQARDAARRNLKVLERLRVGRPPAELAGFASRAATAHAILGEREAAWSMREEAIRQARIAHDYSELENATDSLAMEIAAILGEKDRALTELARIIKLPGDAPRELAADLDLTLLWDDPRFKTMLADPANNAPIPYDVKDERVKL
jgi:TolB-like protein/Tfp pilus assembly protein PilF